MTLNPADIKEIKVLKDAVACALYGIKAANGVIEITSLRGNPDGRTTTSYSFNMGILLGDAGEFEMEWIRTRNWNWSADYKIVLLPVIGTVRLL